MVDVTPRLTPSRRAQICLRVALLLLVLQLLLLLPGCLELLLLLLQYHPVLLLLVRRLLLQLLRRQAPLLRLPEAAAGGRYRTGGTVGVHRLYSQLDTAANTPGLLPICSEGV